MNTDELQNIWKAYDAKLERSLQLNLHIFESMQLKKVTSAFSRLVAFKIVMIVFAFVWMSFVAFLLYHHHTEPVFNVCAVFNIFFSGLSAFLYMKQIALIKTINYDDDIIHTQQKLTVFHELIILTYRIILLPTPMYSFFFLTKKMMLEMSAGWWIFQIAITGFFIALTWFLYKQITFKNRNKKWVNGMLYGEGVGAIQSAKKFLQQIEEFKSGQ